MCSVTLRATAVTRWLADGRPRASASPRLHAASLSTSSHVPGQGVLTALPQSRCACARRTTWGDAMRIRPVEKLLAATVIVMVVAGSAAAASGGGDVARRGVVATTTAG